ncbi:MAG: phosphate ABC transporter substrate-binding protein [Acidobacteriota bacterium]
MRASASVVLSLLACAFLRSSALHADVVAIVSAKSPVIALTQSQIADIFLAKVARFPEGDKAVPLDQPEGSRERDEFYAKVAGKTAAQMKAHWSKIIFTGRGQPPVQAATDTEVRKRVGENPSVIGYIERTMVDASVRVLFSTEAPPR